MTVVVMIRGTDKIIEVEDVVNFKMNTAHFWLKLKGDKYQTFWRRNVDLVRIKDSEVETKILDREHDSCYNRKHEKSRRFKRY